MKKVIEGWVCADEANRFGDHNEIIIEELCAEQEHEVDGCGQGRCTRATITLETLEESK